MEFMKQEKTFNVLVIGKSGLIGNEVFNRLTLADDINVFGYDYPDIDVTSIDLFDAPFAKSLDAVICAFGLNHHISQLADNSKRIETIADIETYNKINLYGLKNVFDYFLKLNPQIKFIHFNSMYSKQIPKPWYYENELKSLGYILSKTAAAALVKYYAILHPTATFIDFIIGAVENNQPTYFKENFGKDLIRKELLDKKVVAEFTYQYIKLDYVTGCTVDITGGKL